ncbi:hypothetical protein KY312_00195 [Candidatus Woesearchaeota archaeon]|nr:hypothetical protein [Candidatus Woesearchaeota archaeon]
MNKKADITWEKVVAIALGVLILFVIASLVFNVIVPRSKILSSLGLKFFVDEEEEKAIDTSLNAFERAFQECSKIKQDNCVCDYPINPKLTEELELEIREKDSKILLRVDYGRDFYESIIDNRYYFMKFQPVDMANWVYRKYQESRPEDFFISNKLMKIKQFENSLGILQEDKSGNVDLPYKLVKWHGKLFFSSLPELIKGRTCNELRLCRQPNKLCKKDEFCTGLEDEWYIGDDICCSNNCSLTPVEVEEWEKLFNAAEKAFESKNYKQAAQQYDSFAALYPDNEKAPYALKRSGDAYLLAGDRSLAKLAWYALVRKYPEQTTYIRLADEQSDSFMNCDAFIDTMLDTNEEIAKCNNDRDSLLRGCYYYDVPWDLDDECRPCQQNMPCSAINNKETCEASPCRNVGQTICTWSFGCKKGARQKVCSDIKNIDACTNDPYCLWSYERKACISFS